MFFILSKLVLKCDFNTYTLAFLHHKSDILLANPPDNNK